MKIVVSKKDVLWGYLGLFFSLASGILILPFLLGLLSAEEIGFYYIMMTISSLTALFDSGFSPMFGKNISIVFSGAQKIQKEGLSTSVSGLLNFHLIATMIKVAEVVYKRLSIAVLIILLTVGTIYVYYVTDEFSTFDNIKIIWFVFSVSSFFNIYFSYYNSLLIGRGKIRDSNISMIITKLGFMCLSIALLFQGLGLLGVGIANLIAPFAGRYYSYKSFYTKDIKNKIEEEFVRKDEVKDVFNIIWYNARKMTISSIGGYCIFRASMFLGGIYLPLSELASYGMMMQICGLVMSLSQNLFISKIPQMTSYNVVHDKENLIELFSMTIIVYWLLAIGGLLFTDLTGPILLSYYKTDAQLPKMSLMFLYSIILILEGNHSMCSSFMGVDNRVPPISASLIPGFFIIVIDILLLEFTSLNLWGLVLSQGLCQLAYNNWKWPLYVIRKLDVTPFYVVKKGTSAIISRTSNLIPFLRCY